MRKLVTAMVLGTALVGFAIGCQDNSKPPAAKPKSDYTTTTVKPADAPKDAPTTTLAPAPSAKPL